MTWLYVLQALPEIINLIRSLTNQMEMRGDVEHLKKREEVKKNLARLAKAIEDGDEKALNDMFNSL